MCLFKNLNSNIEWCTAIFINLHAAVDKISEKKLVIKAKYNLEWDDIS